MANLTATFPTGSTGRSSGRVLVKEPDRSFDSLFVVEATVEEPLTVVLVSPSVSE